MFTLAVSGLSCLLTLWCAWGTKRWIPEWWSLGFVRTITFGWIGLTLIGVLLYLTGIEIGSFETYQLGKFIWALSIIVSAPVAAALSLCFILLKRRKTSHELLEGREPDESRSGASRRTLLRLAMVPPALAGLAGLSGFIRAQAAPVVTHVVVSYAELPPSLDGLRILHLTDAHLGPFVEIDTIDQAVEALKTTRVDIIAITGDFADHLRLMKPAVERLEQLKPTYGIFFAMGNHEYYHPQDELEPLLASLNMQTLVSSGAVLSVGEATLFIAGADDPSRTQESKRPFLKTSIETALSRRPRDAFTVLLCHRPAGFDVAQEWNVELTLAGDTHGYQVGLFGESQIHSLFGEEYPRGHYQRGQSQLYTSTGLGHWFPFRLGCDREVAVITLQRNHA